MRIVLVGILFVFLGLTSGCQTKTGQFFNDCFNGSSPIQDAYSRAFLEQCQKEEQAHRDMMDEIDRKVDEYMENFKKEHAEYYAALDEYSEWYASLSAEHKEIIDRELEEKQIRYNMIHGFNWDGSSGYAGSGRSLSVGIALMYKYKPVWDKIDH